MVPSRTLVSRILGVFFLTATAPTLAGAQTASAKVDRAVRESQQACAQTQSVIISVQPGYRDALKQALQQHGDVISSEMADALTVELHSGDIDEIANQPWVDSVAADSVVYAGSVPYTGTLERISASVAQPRSFFGLRNALRTTLGLAPFASATIDGSGIGVAIVDSGISPSEDFAGRITAFYHVARGNVRAAKAHDDYGHGTHIAGLIGSNGRLSNYEYQGIAPDVRLIGLKVLDNSGKGKTSDVIKALEFLTANKDRLNVHVVNLSLGHPIYAPAKYDPLVRAVEKASKAGLIVVTAAGNFGAKEATGEPGYTGITSPCNAPSAICAGAVNTTNSVTRDDDAVAPYSSRGPSWFDGHAKPDVVAPGHNLVSDTNVSSYLYKQLAANRAHAKNGQPMLRLSGTSMASGVTSGVVALMLQAHNQNLIARQTRPLTPNLTKALLEYTAIRLGGGDYLTQGAGEINAQGAIELASTIDLNRATNAWWLGVGISGESLIGRQSYPWSRHVIWGGNVLSGNLVYVNNIVWGTDIVWGTVDDENILWGTSACYEDLDIVWGTTAVWASNIVWSDRIIGQQRDDLNIVWGTDDENIVWGTLDDENIVWGTMDDENIVWGTWDDLNIVWGTTRRGLDIIWGTNDDARNVIWGTRTNTILGAPFDGGFGGPQGQ